MYAEIMSDHQDILQLFEEKKLLKISAPMVRYSKLPFRQLVRKYNCDLCFTPMIMSDSFVRAEEARQNEFITDELDRPLITQFAANNVEDFVAAAEMVYPYCDGVDLNCGCPQRWAMQDGFGARMLRNPELICDLVTQVRNRLPQPFSVSVKIRLQPNRSDSVELCRRLKHCGVSFVSVHARTAAERRQPADHPSIALITSACPGLPVVANGDIDSLETAAKVQEETGCKGVMSARALLSNPALFRGDEETPVSCIRDWVDLSLSAGVSFTCFHHHLEYMLERALPPVERKLFHCLISVPAVLHFLQVRFPKEFPEPTLKESDPSDWFID